MGTRSKCYPVRETFARVDQSIVFWTVCLIALLFALGRFLVPGHELSAAGSYEAFAHLFVGGLVGAWTVCRERWLLYVVGLLSAVELLAFLTR